MKDTQEANGDFVIILHLCFNRVANRVAKNCFHSSAREAEQYQKETIITRRINSVCIFRS